MFVKNNMRLFALAGLPFSFLSLCLPFRTSAREEKDSLEKWSYHFQATGILQAHSAFPAAYSGANSLQNQEESAFSLTSTLFLGRTLWRGASVYFDPEVAGGKGLSGALGVGGALNGETFRIGDPSPVPFIARAYLQQHIALKRSTYEFQQGDQNQIQEQVPASRITLSAGKFAISDFYDNNRYSHDPRTRFFNWSLMSNGAWDYPANTRGYTSGFIVELIEPGWAIRLSDVAPGRYANGPKMDYNFPKANSGTFEVEKNTKIKGHEGMIRMLVSTTMSKAPSYTSGMDALENNDTLLLKVFSGKYEWNTYGGKKLGIGVNADQELSDNIGIFARASWNDGKYATWAFAEIDQSASLGMVSKGRKWKRPDDEFAFAGVINGISEDHKHFLAEGGYGFILGDGMLVNYGPEGILETYYKARLTQSLWVTGDYQFVIHPGYNRDRGPVHVFGLRAHVEF